MASHPLLNVFGIDQAADDEGKWMSHGFYL
jgi:hypothetical protein